MSRLYKGAFNAGEVSPSLFGNVTIERYPAAARVIRNAFPLADGGLAKRPGMQFVGVSPWDGGQQYCRVIPFKFNNDQTYVLLFSKDGIAVTKDGGMVVTDRDSPHGGPPIPGNPSVDFAGLVTWNNHTYLVGDMVFWREPTNTGGQWLYVSSVTTNTFQLVSAYTGGGTPGTFVNANPDFARVYTQGTGWFASLTDADVDLLDFTQANDTIYVSHPSEATKVITRSADDDWTITDFDPAPKVAAPSGLQEEGTKPAGAQSVWYAVTAIDPDTFEESLAAELEVTSTIDPTSGSPIIIEWDGQDATADVGDIETFRVYRGVSGIYGLVGTASDTTPGGGATPVIQFTDQGYVPNLSIAPPLSADYFNASGKYPGAVELFQQRIWFGRSNNLLQDVYASRAGSLKSFASSTVSVDDDPIEQLISARSVQEVRHFIPLRDLLIMTSDGEWGFDTGDLGYLTPGAGLISHSWWGCAPGVKPAIVGNSAVFADKTARSIRDVYFQAAAAGFESSELSLLAKHLFKNRSVRSICYANTPYQVLFVVFEDGRAASCTYVRDQQIFAWARHDTIGFMRSCTSIEEDGRDNIYLTVERSLDGTSSYRNIMFIERMVMVDPAFSEQGVYLDNSSIVALPTSSDNDLVIQAAVSDDTELTFTFDTAPSEANGQLIQVAFPDDSPLSAINGMVLWIDDNSTTQVVKRGTTAGDAVPLKLKDVFPENVEYQTDPTLGSSEVGWVFEATQQPANGFQFREMPAAVAQRLRGRSAFDEVATYPFSGGGWGSLDPYYHVGLNYPVEVETLPIESPRDPITGLPVQIGDLNIRVEKAQSIQIGRDLDNLTEYDDLSAFIQVWDKQRQWASGVLPLPMNPEWDRDGRMIVRNFDAFPFTLLSITPQIGLGDMDD